MTNLPAGLQEDIERLPMTLGWNLPTGLAIWFDPTLFDHCAKIAAKMADASGFTPAHLLGKPSACLAVVDRALNWKLSPFAVAMCTYQTPGGQIGFMGKLIQAILEQSGKVEGSPVYDHFGDWKRLEGKFELKTSGRTENKYPVPTWDAKDAEGLGVVVRCQIRGEVHPREWELLLRNCFPLNSTLWATNPKKQICYTAIRGFADIACPGLIMGVPWDEDNRPGDSARDITPPSAPPPPRPSRGAPPPDLDEGYRAAMREPEPTESAAMPPSRAADAGDPATAATSGAAGSPPIIDPALEAARAAVDKSLAGFSETKALKTFYFTDAECGRLRESDPEYAAQLYDKHWTRIGKAKAGKT
jgi:hypothetical protein